MGWFLVTVVIPLVAPIVLLAVFWLLPIPPAVSSQLNLLLPIKDGQLCWGAMGFCVSALYEISEASGSATAIPVEMVGWANGGFFFLLLLSALLAAGGSVFPTPMAVTPGVDWRRHFATMLASLVLTVLAAVAYTVIHFNVSSS